MRRIKLTVEYDGTLFHGWQRQKSQRSVQADIEDAISTLTSAPCTLFCAGRTDAGVHGRAQVCHFDTKSKIPVLGFLKVLNTKTASDISIIKAEEVMEDFHARFSAKWRSYEFRLLPRKTPSALRANYAVHIPYTLDVEKMQRVLSTLIGEQDFSAFRTSECQSSTPMCNIHAVSLAEEGDELVFRIKADHFLHNMIRITVGTLVDIGRGHLPENTFETMLKTGNRADGGITLAPQGLYFCEVGYPEHTIIDSAPTHLKKER